jgi:serine beta-lactamase-like protein LACTB
MHAKLSSRSRGVFVSFLCLLAFPLAAAPETDYRDAVRRYEQVIREELQRGLISGVSIALVDDQRVVCAGGFGRADKARRVPATADTVYRAGSISKLFTALMTMQLAEQGRLDIDKPLTSYDPNFRVVAPFDDAVPITLRQLMCHRSGLIRESPVGGYFDDTQPGVSASVASIASCVLVYPPGTKTKYSNIGVTVVGHVAAKVAGQSFVSYQQQHLLGPIGMGSSGFLPTKAIRENLARGYLPVADGKGGFREIEAPRFELGTIPAGNLYTTANDLARFLSFLFAEGRAGGRPLVKPATLAAMFTPQLTPETNGFGLGFAVGSFRGHKTVSHMGAVYGFTSSVIGLPQHKLGVVVLVNDDIATGPVRRLANAGLALLLEAKLGERPPAKPAPLQLPRAELAPFAGDYESESWWAKLDPGEGVLRANVSGQRMTLTPVAPLKFEANGRIVHEGAVTFERGADGKVAGFTALNQKFRRVDPKAVPDVPAAWRAFPGSYGPDFIPLIVSVKHGHLYAMTENEFDNRLAPLNRYVFKMPPGLYTDEQLVFQADARGQVHSAVLANMTLKRRAR